MTALGKLFRTTVFKLSIVYLIVFTVSSGLVIGWMAWNVRHLVDEQIAAAINAEITGLSEQYAQGGIRRLVLVVDSRTRRPGSSLYLVTNAEGLPIAGNVTDIPSNLPDRQGLVETYYQRPESGAAERLALVRMFQLPGGFRLLVGRDVEEREALGRVVSRALTIALIWLIVIGTFGGLFVARRVLRRVDAMNASAQNIMKGNMAERLPVTGSSDELDRLAANLNAMLDRIGELMAGLREVSDNIAHDLRTPLNRLRARAEEALRSGKDNADYHTALEQVIDESDQLIRIFNALLLIARAEAGSGAEMTGEFDLAQVVHDVAELYEPAAEEAGLKVRVDAPGPVSVRGNRELVGQAIANLVDNAIKYGSPALPVVAQAGDGDGAAPAYTITLQALRSGQGGEVIVADHGPGVAIEDRGRVTERFVRLEHSRSRQGSGLGLSLASAVARLHAGDLKLEDNKPGLKTILSLNLPPA